MRLGKNPAQPNDETLIRRMTDTMAHRGPNDSGVWQDPRVSLGHRRLSVIDLSPAGHQPMTNEDGAVILSYNGEVYNFMELREQFKLDDNHQFRSKTDSEVLIHLYEELGLDMAEHLIGMFAIAIWDTRTQELHMFRDRYGIKPFFYQKDDEAFRFGSEIKAIIADEHINIGSGKTHCTINIGGQLDNLFLKLFVLSNQLWIGIHKFTFLLFVLSS
jgi:asparagine synthase (glutamine-hydrolysing)